MKNVGAALQVLAGILCLGAPFLPFGTAAAADTPLEAPPDKALIYLIQGPTGAFANLIIRFDGQTVWSGRPNTSFAFVADPGEHEISTAAVAPARLPLTVVAGETYYVHLQVTAGGVPQMRQLKALEGVATSTGAALSSDRPARAARDEGVASRENRERYSSGGGGGGRFAFIFKSGSLEMLETRQTVGIDFEFESRAERIAGFEAEWRSGSGGAFGVEVYRYRNAVDVLSDLEVEAYMLNAKKYFNRGGRFRPFIGVGAGAVAAKFIDDPTRWGAGPGYQAMLGVELISTRPGANLGLFVEMKYLSGNAEDDFDNELKVGAKGVLGGITIQF